MKTRYLVLFVLILTAAYGGYRYWNREQPVEISIVSVARGRVESTVANTRAGTVKARHRARLAPAIGGQIASLDVQKGDVVQKGRMLLTLWNDDLRAQLELRRKEVLATEALARESCLLADFAERDGQRSLELRQKKSSSEALYDKAMTTAAAKRIACEVATIQVAVSQARVRTVEAQLDRTILRAPFAGIVAEINGEIGEFITPSPTGVATLPAVDLINLEDLFISAPIDEMDAARIVPGLEARLSLDAYPDRLFNGVVLRIAPYVFEQAKQARTVEVECGFKPKDRPENLLAGYSADVEIIIAAKHDTLRIPAEALLEGSAVYILNKKNNRLQRREITTGLANWKYVEVLSGIAEGDPVVSPITGQDLKDGVLVHVVPAEESSEP